MHRKKQNEGIDASNVRTVEKDCVNDTTVKMRLPSTVHVIMFLMGIVFFICLNGCANKTTVIYTPHENCSNPMPQLPELDKNEEVTEALRGYFINWEGTRYKFGGLSHNGVDCSGFTLLTYKELFGKNLPRTVREQAEEGTKISKASLQAGDLVFFKIGLNQKHVGIYLENNLFIHASGSKGVTISNLDNIYWKGRYLQAQRI
jgi:probable lipoprotein NlpC